MLYGRNLKNSVNLSLMRSEQDLTCSQAFSKESVVWMIGTVTKSCLDMMIMPDVDFSISLLRCAISSEWVTTSACI